jgi:hypothetical protein
MFWDKFYTIETFEEVQIIPQFSLLSQQDTFMLYKEKNSDWLLQYILVTACTSSTSQKPLVLSTVLNDQVGHICDNLVNSRIIGCNRLLAFENHAGHIAYF